MENINNKKCLITGGAGFVGSNLSLKLEELGNNVTVLDDFIVGNRDNLKGFGGRIIEGDENKLFNLRERFDIVFHQAAITDTTLNDRGVMFEKNVEGFKKVLNFCEKNKSKLVYASSAAVYGDGPCPMKEGQEPRPLNVYGESKLEMDKIAQQRFGGGNSGISVVGLRYFNVFGPREHFKGSMASMIYQLARQIKKGENPRIFKYGEQARDYIYIKDVVGANLKAAAYKGFGIFNIGTGTKTSFNELIKYLNEALKTDYNPVYFDNPHTGFYQNITIADLSMTRRELGFTSSYDVCEGIKDYVKWLNSIEWHDSL